MKFIIAAVVAAAAVANAQVVFNNETNTFDCLGDAAGKNFCAGDSLQTNIIIRCSGAKGQPGNCNDNLAGIPPVGVKTFAPCYQTSNTSGDAACSFDGTAYPDSGQPFKIPGGSSSSSSMTETSTQTETETKTSTAVYTTTASSSAVTYPVTTSSEATTVYITTEATTTTAASSTITVPRNATTYTTSSLPVPTQSGSAGSTIYQNGFFAGVMAIAAAAML